MPNRPGDAIRHPGDDEPAQRRRLARLSPPFVAFTAMRLADLDRGWPLIPLVAFAPWVALVAAAAALARSRPAPPRARSRGPRLLPRLTALLAPRALEDEGERPPDAVELRALTVNLLGDEALQRNRRRPPCGTRRPTRSALQGSSPPRPNATSRTRGCAANCRTPCSARARASAGPGSTRAGRSGRDRRSPRRPRRLVAALRPPAGPAVEILAGRPRRRAGPTGCPPGAATCGPYRPPRRRAYPGARRRLQRHAGSPRADPAAPPRPPTPARAVWASPRPGPSAAGCRRA